MADMEQALDRLLGDPEAMAQIMDLAGRLNPSHHQNSESGETEGGQDLYLDDRSLEDPPASTENAKAPAGQRLEDLAPLLALLRQGGGTDPRSDALLQALRPYLSESRRKKLDRAIRLSALARTARTAIGLWKEGELSV